jgi:hypothetical protein
MKQISQIFDAWPDPKVANVARDLGITTEHAAQMKARGSIPVRYWPRLVDSAKERGIRGINYDVLVSLHSENAA